MSQVIKKRRIVLASVLKPVDDTRMLEKIGATLQETGKFEITIIGYPSTRKTDQKNITLILLSPFKRISFSRILVPWKILKKTMRLKPDYFIFNTHELILPAILLKIFLKVTIVYDVLENHYLNIRFTNTFNPILKNFIAGWVRLKERLTVPLITTYILAEKGYRSEITFIPENKQVIIENKLPRKIAEKYPRQKMRDRKALLFTGTLAETTGIFEAIRLAKQLHGLDDQYTLTIIGYSAHQDVLNRIDVEIRNHPFINLKGGKALVPHAEILEEIQQAGTGIIIYPENPSTRCSIPTKLFEYLALGLPVLIKHNPESHQLVTDHEAGIIITPETSAQEIHDRISGIGLPHLISRDIFWESEEQKLHNLFIVTK